jgi:hypothetical protein
MVALVDLLSSTYAPVQAMIISHIRVRDTIALSRTCKELRIQVPAFLSATDYNINYHLKRFFADPKEFRSVQGATSALIYGDFARTFLAGTAGKTLEMKIAVESGWWYVLEEYLDKEGYVLKGYVLKGYVLKGYVLKSRTYEKYDAAGQTLKVSLAGRDNAPIATVLAAALSTSDLDIISWAKAYSLFGCATHVKGVAYLLGELDETRAAHLRNLTENESIRSMTTSWARRRTCWGARAYGGFSDADKMTRRRRIGDSFTRIYALDVEGVIVPPEPQGVLESTTFSLRTPQTEDIEGPVSYYKVEFDETIRHPVLEYKFVTLKEDQEDGSVTEYDDFDQRMRTSYYSQKCDELNDHLDELTVLELTKIPTKDRPAAYRGSLNDLNRACLAELEFDVPSSWSYCDLDVIEYLAEAWKNQLEYDEQQDIQRKKRILDEVARIRVDE